MIHQSNETLRTTPSESRIAWLSGIIDGEGTICRYQMGKRSHQHRGYILGVVVVNTDLNILNEVQSIYTDLGIVSKRNQKSASKKQREGSYKFTKPCYEIVIRRREDIHTLLDLLIPYLIGDKKQKAIDLKEWIEHNPRLREGTTKFRCV